MDPSWIGLLFGVALVVGLIVFLDRMLVGRERHWELDDKERPRSPHVGVGNALLELHDLLQPGARGGIEEQQRVRREDEGEGDPPER